MGVYQAIQRSTNQLHRRISQAKFSLHYQDQRDLHIFDHYQMLLNLYPLYAALEVKMNEVAEFNDLLQTFPELFERSAKIQQDINVLNALLPHSAMKLKVCPAMQTYIKSIEALDPVTQQPEILGHFLTRILGDLLGGQAVKQQVSEKLSDRVQQGGVTFYQFSDRMLRKLRREWLNDAHEIVDEDRVAAASVASFEKHFEIFDEMEAIRAGYAGTSEWAQSSRCQFSLFNKTTAATTGIAVVAVAAYLGS